MVRRARVEVEGGLYQVYNRIASGEPVFSVREEAIGLIELIRETKARDGWTVLAWCVMSNHYHLVIRTATVPLWRVRHRIQNLFSRRSHLNAIRVGTRWKSESAGLTWHPFASEERDQSLTVDRASAKVDYLARSTDQERPTLTPTVFVEAVCDLLDIDMAVVCSRARDRQTAAVRKLMVTLGVERWRQPRTGLAKVLHKNPDVVSWWAGEGATSRIKDPEYAAELDRLDQGVAAGAAERTASERVGRIF